MSLKDDVSYIKNELSSQEKLLENFVRGERFFKKYKTLIISIIVILVVLIIGFTIKTSIDNSNKHEANIAFNKFLENGDEKELQILKSKNAKLYEIALYLQAKNNNTYLDIKTPFLKELMQFEKAVNSKNIEELNNLAMQGDFLLKDFANLNKALILANEQKYEDARKALSQIPNESNVIELANLFKHYLLTK